MIWRRIPLITEPNLWWFWTCDIMIKFNLRYMQVRKHIYLIYKKYILCIKNTCDHMWSISTLVTPKGDDQMADIQAERIQPPHRRCVVVKKPTVDFQNFLTTEKYLGGWRISTKCSNCTHLFWLKLIALSHYQSLKFWWKVRLSLFKTSENPFSNGVF